MKKVFLIFIFIIFMCNIALVSAEDNNTEIQDVLQNTEETVHDTVSGDVIVISENPWDTTGELQYKIPSDAKNIKNANLYVNVYSGSGSNKFGAYCNVSLTTHKATSQLGCEELCFDYVEDTMYDSEVYNVNDHITKSVSDYQITYNITDLLQNLKTSSFITIHVDTYKHPDKQFDGRIKSICLLVAYDDGDDDEINYWIDSTQRWTQDSLTQSFNTDNITNDNFLEANLLNIALSSNKGLYSINDNLLMELNHVTGNYFQYDNWDVSNHIIFGQNTTFYSKASSSSQYSKNSLKNVLTLLKIKKGRLKVKTTLNTEYTDTCFAGTNNILTININTNKPEQYHIKLYANQKLINSTEIKLNSGTSKVYLTDNIIRSINESTVNGKTNNHVNYTVEFLLNDSIVKTSHLIVPILYNGYLSKNFAYPMEVFQSFFNQTFNGDFIINTKDTGFLSSTDMSRTDVWNINLDDTSKIINGLIYIPYNWFNGDEYCEDESMFNITFNNIEITPIIFIRDQSNIGGYAKYGYGILIYNITGLINKGENTLVLNKKYPTPSVYPSSLIYITNNTSGKFTKKIYAITGADVLFNDYNLAKRIIKIDSNVKINISEVTNAELYVFAASAEKNDGNIIFNNKTFSNVWKGSSSSTSIFKADISDIISEDNTLSFVSTGSTILALPYFIVTYNNITEAVIESTEYENICYAGTYNIIKVLVNTNTLDYYTIKLYADSKLVNTTSLYLHDSNRIFIIDPTIRGVDENTVYGKNNTEINYTIELLLTDEVISTSQLLCKQLYNGYLNKSYEYNASYFESFYKTSFNGNLVIDTKDESSYLSEFDPKRVDSWNIKLNTGCNIVKSFIFVPFTNFNPIFSFNDVKTQYNNAEISPCQICIDRANLVNNHLSGVLIYDVTDMIKNGDNTFTLTKTNPTPCVYPSSLIYIYNTTDSCTIKTISMITGADLLSNYYNLAGRIIQTTNIINSQINDLADAEMYIMAAAGEENDGNIIFNNKTFENIWKGSEKTTNLFKSNIYNIINDTNSITFQATGNTILLLPQIIVTTQKTPTKINTLNTTVYYNTNNNLIISLTETNGNPINGVKIKIVLNGVEKEAITNQRGQIIFTIPNNLLPKTYDVSLVFTGDNTHIKSSANTKITVKKSNVKLTAKKKTFKAKIKVKKYVAILKDNNRKTMKKVKISLKIKGKKTITAVTDSKGKAIFKIKKLTKGKYSAEVTFKGNQYFNPKTVKKIKITVKK